MQKKKDLLLGSQLALSVPTLVLAVSIIAYGIHAHTHVRPHMHPRTLLHTHAHARSHACMHARTHARTHKGNQLPDERTCIYALLCAMLVPVHTSIRMPLHRALRMYMYMSLNLSACMAMEVWNIGVLLIRRIGRSMIAENEQQLQAKKKVTLMT